jgi:hypothetical protein
LEGRDPAANAAGIDAEEVGDLDRGVAVEDAFNGEPPPVFQFRG